MCHTLLFLGFEGDRTGTLALFQSLFIPTKYFVSNLGLLVASGLCLFLHFGDSAIYRFQILDLKLHVDDLLVTDRIDTTIYMDNIIVVKAT